MKKLLQSYGLLFLLLSVSAHVFGAVHERQYGWEERVYVLPPEQALNDRFKKISPVIAQWAQYTRVVKDLAEQEMTVLLAATTVESAFVEYIQYLQEASSPMTVKMAMLMLGNKGAEPDILRAIFQDNPNPQAMADVEVLIREIEKLRLRDEAEEARLRAGKV